jgi:Ca2+-binding RTX toxin-like protein
MPSVSVTASGDTRPILFTTDDAFALAQKVSEIVSQTKEAFTTQIDTGGTTNFLSPSTTGIRITATGPTTVVGAAPVENLIAGIGGVTFYSAPNSIGQVVISGGNNTIGLAPGTTYSLVTGAGNDLIYTNGSGTIDAGAGTNTVMGGSGLNNVIISYGTGDVIALGSGTDVAGEFGTGAIIFGGSGAAVIADGGNNDTVVGGSGPELIYGGDNGHYFLGSGPTTFVSNPGPGGSDTIVAGTGSETVFGGASDLIFAGSSNLDFIGGMEATINGGSGHDTIFGQAGSSIAYFGNAGQAQIIAGSGNETLSAAGSTAGIVFFAGSGNATLSGGTGPDIFAFGHGQVGGTDLINNFNSTSQIDLLGYGPNEIAGVLASATTANGGTTITLSDNTKITLTSVSSLNSSQIKGF